MRTPAGLLPYESLLFSFAPLVIFCRKVLKASICLNVSHQSRSGSPRSCWLRGLTSLAQLDWL